ncbi:MAG: hypothetical protein LPK19_03315 [Hymenobacteraceae bacterium]|nr:hypothetical protein [Hymenobacteraceae bacterium]MDX5395221.1 hypothetical protein [Hymenobacteraceae bacterium]MDX5511259.1 hypothetical protein [Hymenobacteraceae bacterium]
MRKSGFFLSILLLIGIIPLNITAQNDTTVTAPPDSVQNQLQITEPAEEDKEISKTAIVIISTVIAITSILIYNVRSK